MGINEMKRPVTQRIGLERSPIDEIGGFFDDECCAFRPSYGKPELARDKAKDFGDGRPREMRLVHQNQVIKAAARLAGVAEVFAFSAS